MNPHNAEGYIANMVEALLGYTAAIARSGVEHAAKIYSYPPSKAELIKACEAVATRETNFARFLSYTPKPPISRKVPPPDPAPGPDGKHPPGTILANFHEAVAIYGRPIGAFEPGRQNPYGRGS